LGAQPLGSADETDDAARPPLQEVLSTQPAVLVGLIAHLVAPLQDDIVRAAGRLLRPGQDILATSAAGTPPPMPDYRSDRGRGEGLVQQDHQLGDEPI
jgi:hypothetical protein